MNNKVVDLYTTHHNYDIEECAGCGELIKGEYIDIGLPSADGSRVEHIALCDPCGEVAEGAGVF